MGRENFLLKLTSTEGEETHVLVSNITHIVRTKGTEKKPAHTVINTVSGKVEVVETVEVIVNKSKAYASLLVEVK